MSYRLKPAILVSQMTPWLSDSEKALLASFGEIVPLTLKKILFRRGLKGGE